LVITFKMYAICVEVLFDIGCKLNKIQNAITYIHQQYNSVWFMKVVEGKVVTKQDIFHCINFHFEVVLSICIGNT